MTAVGVHTVTIGDTLVPLNALLRWANGDPVDLSLYTVKVFMELEDGTSELAATISGVSAHPTQTFTANATTDLLTCNGHQVQDGDQVILSSSQALPAGLASATRYFATQVSPNSFGLSTFPDGPLVNITDTGTGTHSFYVVGNVQYDFAAANVDTAQTMRLWFTVTSGSEVKTLPEGDRWFEIRVVSAGN